MSKKVPLSSLSRELAVLTGKPAPTYRALWNKVADGALPVETINGRHFADPREVAEVLGLTIKVAA